MFSVVNFNSDQPERRTGIWLVLHMFYVSSRSVNMWVVLKADPCGQSM